MSGQGDLERVVVLDFGSQYSQLIARRVRECGVYSRDPAAHHARRRACASCAPSGIILSGGPASVYEPARPSCDRGIFELGHPGAGHLLRHAAHGAAARRRGRARRARASTARPTLDVAEPRPASSPACERASSRLDEPRRPWSQAARRASRSSAHQRQLARRRHGRPERGASTACSSTPRWSTPRGAARSSATSSSASAAARADWTHGQLHRARPCEASARRSGGGRVICGLSGGVDSSVAAALLHRAIGDRLTCIFVDNGLLRKGEARAGRATLPRALPHEPACTCDAAERFLGALAGVTDPEQKRKIIGATFIEVFEEEAAQASATSSSSPRARSTRT